jgi:hypothetical protein
MPGEYLILSSTDALARDLIDAVRDESARKVEPVSGTHSLASIDGVALAAILESNREALIRQNMVEEGNTREQAEGEIGMLLTIAKAVRKLKMTVGHRAETAHAALEVTVDLP